MYGVKFIEDATKTLPARFAFRYIVASRSEDTPSKCMLFRETLSQIRHKCTITEIQATAKFTKRTKEAKGVFASSFFEWKTTGIVITTS